MVTVNWDDADLDDAQDNSGFAHDAEDGNPSVDYLRRGYSFQTGLGGDLLNNGLVGWWPLHEQAKVATDLSGNGNDGTVNGATQGVAGVGGLTAYSFDGSNDYVDTNSVFGTLGSSNETNFSLWVNTTTTARKLFFGWNVSGGDRIFLQSNSDASTNTQNGWLRVFHKLNNVTASVDTGGDVGFNDGNWHHISINILKDTDVIEIYVDGVLETSAIPSLGQANWGRDLFIGAENNGGSDSDNIDSLIQDFRIYNRALSSAEIQTLYEWGSVDTARPPDNNDGGVSYYQLDGDANDSWGTNDGTISGATSTTDAIRGTAYDFNGSSDYIDTGNNFTELESSAFTLSTWVNFDNASNFGAALVQRDTSNDGVFLGTGGNADDVDFRVNDGASNISVVPDNVISENDWYHLVGTFDSGDAKVYINGAFVDSASGGSTAVTTGENLYIGANQTNTGAYVDGTIDEVRIYDRALSQREVSQLYRYGTFGRDMRKLTTENKL